MNRRAFLRRVGAGFTGAVGTLSAGCFRYEQPRRPSSNSNSGPGSPGSADGGSVIFSSPLDSQAEIDRFPEAGVSNADNISIAPDPAGTGRDVVSVHVPEDEVRGASLAYAPNEVRDGSRTGENDPDAAYVRQHIYFPEDTVMTGSDGDSEGTKMGGVAGFYTDAANGGDPADGHSWSARLQTDGNGNGTFTPYYYVYHLGDSSGFGDVDHFDGEYAFGQWHAITLYVEMNTPGQNDGILRAWMGGNLVYEREDFAFRDADHPYAGITRAYGGYIYWGGSWGSPATQNVYFKDFTFRNGDTSTGGQ